MDQVAKESSVSEIKKMLGIIIVILLVVVGLLIEPRIRLANLAKSIQKVDDARTQIKNMGTGLMLYRLDNGNYPTTEQGLLALAGKPTIGPIPKNYKSDGYIYGKIVPKDPWNNDYVYVSPGDHGGFDLYSYGADGLRGGEGPNADIQN